MTEMQQSVKLSTKASAEQLKTRRENRQNSEFFLDNLSTMFHDSRETSHQVFGTRMVVPHKTEVKSLTPVASGKLTAFNGGDDSLSVRLSLKKQPIPVRNQEQGGKYSTGQWDRAASMSSFQPASKQAAAELTVQLWWSQKFAAGRLHSLIKYDAEIDDVTYEPVNGFSFLDEVELEKDVRKASRRKHKGKMCCSQSGCIKKAQAKGKCISHGGVRNCKEPGCTAVARWRSRCSNHGGRHLCLKENCEKLAASGGKYISHGGGGNKQCSVPNCTTRPQRRGLCTAHGGYLVCKTEGCERRAATKGLCSHHNIVGKCPTEGCEKPGQNRGYCYKHGVESGAIKVSRKPKCKVDECVNIQLRQGYCYRHAKERGFTVGRTCKIEGCNKVAQAGGCCSTHGGGSRCKYSDCNKPVSTKGVCSAHGGRKMCKVVGCIKWGLSSGDFKGYCVEHGGGYRCKHPGCSKSVQYNGLCCTHGGKLKCAAKGCNKNVRVKGYCPIHQNTHIEISGDV